MLSPLPGQPNTRIFSDRQAAGAAAAQLVQTEIARAVATTGRARIIVGCAPSQDDFFAALVALARATPELWGRVELFHMDDYVGLTAAHPQSFRHYLQRHFLDHVPVGAFAPVQGEAPDPAAEARRYAGLLEAAPIDIVTLGFGENGHLAFIDPPVADFHDPALVKIVEMDPACRQQQVNDGCFPTIADVPRHAITITLPVFVRAGMLCGIVPTVRKAAAVRAALTGPVGPACPATLLRTHPGSHLFLDPAAASLLPAGIEARYRRA
jgi:glucosamine-6-phosphate deaminase